VWRVGLFVVAAIGFSVLARFYEIASHRGACTDAGQKDPSVAACCKEPVLTGLAYQPANSFGGTSPRRKGTATLKKTSHVYKSKIVQ
jgi:hypothetical protein